jgi:hypothetical protein
VDEEAAGNVTVIVAVPLQTMKRSVDATVNDAVFVTGAAPVTVRVLKVAFPLLMITLSNATPV